MSKFTTYQFVIKLIFILVVFLFASCGKKVESETGIKTVIRTKADDLLDLANKQIDSLQYDSGIILLDSALKYDGSVRTVAECFAAKGYCYHKKENYVGSLENYLEATSRFEEIKDSVRLAQMWMNMATTYKILGDLDEATKFALRSIEIVNNDNDFNRELAILYNILGNIYRDMGNWSSSKDYHVKSLNLREKSKKTSTSVSINNIGILFFYQKKYDSALVYFENYKSKSIKANINSKMVRAYRNLSMNYLKLKEYDKCKMYLDSACVLQNRGGLKRSLISIGLLKSDYYLNYNLDKSEREAINTMKICRSLNAKKDELEVLERLIQISIAKNNTEKTLQYFMQHKSLGDSINKALEVQKIHAYDIKSKLKVKDKELKSIEEQKKKSEHEKRLKTVQRNFFLALFFLATCLIYILYNKYNAKKKFVQEYLKTEKGVVLKTGMKLDFTKIRRIETRRNDLIIITSDGEIIEKNTTLKEFIPHLPKIYFGRPQRGIVVNFNLAKNVLKTKLDFQDQRINITAKYRNDFHDGWNAFRATRKG